MLEDLEDLQVLLLIESQWLVPLQDPVDNVLLPHQVPVLVALDIVVEEVVGPPMQVMEGQMDMMVDLEILTREMQEAAMAFCLIPS